MENERITGERDMTSENERQIRIVEQQLASDDLNAEQKDSLIKRLAELKGLGSSESEE